MATAKERERPQGQEVPTLPKRRQDWRLPSKREEQKFHGTEKILLSPSMTAEKPASMRSSNRHTRLRSKNPIVHPQKSRTSWLLDARKPKPDLGLRSTLTEVVRETFTTGWSFPASQRQERVLLAERYALLELRYSAPLSDAQVARLHWIEEKLDELDDQDPVEQEADRRLAQTSDKLDEILSLLRSLPRKSSIQEDAGQ